MCVHVHRLMCTPGKIGYLKRSSCSEIKQRRVLVSCCSCQFLSSRDSQDLRQEGGGSSGVSKQQLRDENKLAEESGVALSRNV